MGWVFSLFGISRWGGYVALAGLFLALLFIVALTFWSKGRASRLADILNAQIREQRRALDIRKKQLQDATNRPDDDQLDELLDNGEF